MQNRIVMIVNRLGTWWLLWLPLALVPFGYIIQQDVRQDDIEQAAEDAQLVAFCRTVTPQFFITTGDRWNRRRQLVTCIREGAWDKRAGAEGWLRLWDEMYWNWNASK